jgi:hypothetical protein
MGKAAFPTGQGTRPLLIRRYLPRSGTLLSTETFPLFNGARKDYYF